MTAKKKFLFIFHDDSRTGAPMLLYNFLLNLKQRQGTDISFDIYIKNVEGGLFSRLQAIADHLFYRPKIQYKNTADYYLKRIIQKLQKSETAFLSSLVRKNDYATVVGNTVVTLELLSNLANIFKQGSFVLYVHESEYMCDVLLSKRKAVEELTHISKFIAVSHSCAENLIVNYGVPSERIAVVYPAIPKDNYEEPVRKQKDRFTIMTAGYAHLTKGTDLVPQIAMHLRTLAPDLKFVVQMIGIREESVYLKAIKNDIKKLNLQDIIQITPPTAQPVYYLSQADCYIIPSREDSFSLMGVQAAYYNVPIVAFDKAVGLMEILDSSCSYIVPYLDTKAFAAAILSIFEQRKEAIRKADNSLKRVKESLAPLVMYQKMLGILS